MLYTMSSSENNTRERILHATWQLMEQHLGKVIKMSDVAKAAGISRQAVYLHFKSRTELIVATSQYVDNLKGLGERLIAFKQAKTATEQLEACVNIWGNYIPEIIGIAKALMAAKDSDEAMAAAWNGNMGYVRDICGQTINALHDEGLLASQWSKKSATDIFWSTLSINNWEQLTRECGWSTPQYVQRITALLKNTLVSSKT